jgi:hypothetical protein
MQKTRVTWKSLLTAALVSALASLLIVAVGPGFTKNADKEDKSNGNSAAAADPSNSGNSAAATSSEADTKDHGKGSDHDGDADANSSTTYTEDNDTNDGNTPNNVVDDGDNAHPSGKDRSVEHGNRDKNPNQGKSESNPDDSKGPQRYEGGRGEDKPNGPGGADLADQDGNNGCGNDDDFDDDNNGHCGGNKPPKVDCNGDNDSSNNHTCNPTTVCPPGSKHEGKPPPGGDMAKCNPPTKDCNGDNDSSNNHTCNPTLCPPGSKHEGKPPPGGDMSKCDNGKPDKVTICHRTGSQTNPWVVITVSENALPAHLAHGDMYPVPSGGCDSPPPPQVCPADSDMPGQEIPGGNLLNCYPVTPPPTVLCPAGTDMAGEPIPGGSIRRCNKTIVKPNIIERDPKPEVEGELIQRPATRGGRILPFTGANLIAYLILALELLGAGLLLVRGRRRR